MDLFKTNPLQDYINYTYKSWTKCVFIRGKKKKNPSNRVSYLWRHLLHVGPVSRLIGLLWGGVVVPHTDLHLLLFLPVRVAVARHGHLFSTPVVLHRFGSCNHNKNIFRWDKEYIRNMGDSPIYFPSPIKNNYEWVIISCGVEKSL